MAHFTGLIVSEDDDFRKAIGQQLRSGAVPIGVTDDRAPRGGAAPDIVVVDARGFGPGGMASIEALRAAAPAAGIFAVADGEDPALILQSMRAGANGFFAWPPPANEFQEAVRRTVSRRQSTATQPSSTTFVFVGAKGGAGTTTLAVNCAVEGARLTRRPTVIVELKAGLGELTRFPLVD